jgi:hypothetical protein
VNLKQMLRTINTVLVMDWPSKNVPEALMLAGFHVIVHGGLGPEDNSVYGLNSGDIVIRQRGRRSMSGPVFGRRRNSPKLRRRCGEFDSYFRFVCTLMSDFDDTTKALFS